MILYTTHITPRIVYMAQWLGNRLFGKPLQVVTHTTELPLGVPVINYSSEVLLEDCFTILPHGLLLQTGVKKQNIAVTELDGLPVFFKCDAGNYPFDILSAVFYLITRYEEYAETYEEDEYGRYSHTNSLAYRNGFLKRPVVDEYLTHLKCHLKQYYPALQFEQLESAYLPTIDVDVAWSYRHKGLQRNAGGLLRDLLRGKVSLVAERVAVLSGFKNDPFATLHDFEETHRYYGLPQHLFFLLAFANKGYDKNISPHSHALQALMQWCQQRGSVGVHFSWAASQNEVEMNREKALIDKVLKAKVRTNRMHYVNFRLPDTFRQLVACGITADYSMGYGTINGFRSGTSHPYTWYDVLLDEPTPLSIYPFAWMEANSIFEQKDSPEQALAELQSMYEKVKQTGGLFCTIMHNHLMGLDAEGRKWWMMYHRFLKQNFTPAPVKSEA